VVEPIEEDRGVLAQTFRALRPGGGLIVTVPQHRFLWSRYEEHAHHVPRHGGAEIVEKLPGLDSRS
jgi:predicted SAM-dependent methyltransferase